jgi:hypothetical protein
MRCPGCGDKLSVSADRCTFCTYNLLTGRRGVVEAPPPGAVRQTRRQGVLLLAVGVPALLVSTFLMIVPFVEISRIVTVLFFLPASGGMVARGLNQLAQSRRWQLKQKLHDETRINTGGPTAPVAGFSGG